MPVSGDIPRELTGAHREAHEYDVAQVEGLEDRVQVGGEGVIVVAAADLGRLPEAATIVGDHPEARREQLACLLLPAMTVERVPVDEHHRLSGSLILVVQLDRRAVLLPNGDEGHCVFPFCIASTTLAAH